MAALVLAAGVAGAPERLVAQAPPPRAMPELRADLLTGRQPAAQLGAGVQLAIGYYVRVGVVGAGGVRIDDAGARPASSSALDGRADVLVRFLLDPFRQTSYGLSVGGGMSVRAEPGDRARPLLLVALELEGRRGAGGWVPAAQLGLGGGVRIGMLLRRAPIASR